MTTINFAFWPEKSGLFFFQKRIYLGKLWTPFVWTTRHYFGSLERG